MQRMVDEKEAKEKRVNQENVNPAPEVTGQAKVNEEVIDELKKKNKQKKINKFKIFAVLIIVVILVVLATRLLMGKTNVFHKKDEVKESIRNLSGQWTTDGNTVYEFKEDGTGALIVPVLTVPFTYTEEDGKIHIDFENEDSTDSDYEYTFEDDQLVLRGINMTAGIFVFNRVEENTDAEN